MSDSMRFTRRRFLGTSLATGAALTLAAPAFVRGRGLNEKLNIATIGTGGMGGADLDSLAGENIVALCDVDENTLNVAAGRFPKAKKYFDFRKMLESEEKQIDAVQVSTPDHIHAPASVMAMKMGKHCFCQKPLAHDVTEARTMAKLAAEKKLATQMGTQIHAGDNYRRVVEIVQSGAIGPVREAVVWCGKDWGGGRHRKAEAPPKHLHWDLWLGPAAERPYEPGVYHPQEWRRWWDFGTGTLGDMACHLMDLPFWALGLKHPLSVEAEGPPVDPDTTPTGMKVTLEFPARGGAPSGSPPVKFTWSDGNRTPKQVAGHDVPFMGVMFIGEKGQMFADYGGYRLYPEEQFKGFRPPPQTIPASIGHYAEWIRACKEGTPTTCNFGYSGALSEAVLLGNVAYRVGKKFQWDAENLKAVNCPQADQYLRREYRQGWTL